MSLHGSHRLARAGAVVVIGLVVLAAPCFADWWQAAGPLPDGYATVSGAHEFQNEGVDEGGDCDWECAQSMWTSWRITEHNADVMYRNNGYYWTVQGDGGSGQVEVDSSALGVACSPGVVPTGTAPGTGTYGADGYVWVYCKAPEPFEEQCQPPARKRKIWVLDVNLETPWGGGPGNNIEGLHNGDGSDIDREGYDASSYNHPVRINHNRDDDDENGTPDVEQSGPVPGEDDLIPVQIQVTEGIRQHQQGTVKLTVSGWEDCQGGVFPDLKLWRDASKASQIVLTDGLSKTYSCAAFLSEVIDGSGGWVYVECCVPAGSWYPDMRVFLSVAYQTNSQMDDPEDTIAFDPFWADLRIDSDNTNNFGSPDNSDHEEEIEDIAGDPAYPGKLVPTNDNDNDADGIPDYADGFDLDGEEGTDDDRTGGEQFVPMFLGLGHPMNYSQTRITFVYDASDPSGVTAESGQYTLPSGGALRLWTKPGDAERNKNSVEAGGDFVPAGVPVAASHFQSAGMGLALYVEGVRTSQSAADRRIIAIVEPDGPDAISIPQSDAVRVTVVRLDADVDSDNTNGFDAPDRSDDEDAIEDIAGDPDYPGKVLTVNDDDDDHDGVPDYADGFDLDGQADTPDDLNESEHFTPLVIELSPGFDPTTAQLWIDYSDSDPAGVTHQGTPAVYSLPTGGGLLRLWTKDGSQARNKAAVGGGGDFVPKLTWVDVADLNPSGNTITLYAEGVYACSSLAAPARIRVEADPDGDGPAWFVHGDAVRLSVLGADLDIDSDNNNGTANPDHNAYEDQIEDIADDPDYPGKYLDVNGNDDDNDGVPDFADGFDLDGQQGNADDANANEYFARVVLCLPDPIDRDIATVRLTYDASDPAAVVAAGDPVTYTLPTSGKLRLWTKNGYESRNKNSVSDPQSPGDYVPPGDHDATALGFSTYGGLVTFYVEGTQASHAIADQRLLVEIDPDGLVGPLSFVPHDAVRITVLGVDLDIDSDNDNALDAPDRSAYEDQIEDTANNPAYPGKVLEPNDNDDDSDGIPDFADGFNFDGQAGNADDQNASEDFAQLVLEVPAPISLTNATVTITYDASDPAAVTYDTQTQTYTPGDGALRLWTQDGSVARNKATLLQGGHYVPPKTYDASDLGLSGESRTITITPPDSAGRYRMDWTMIFTARDREVVLGRTPIPGEPGGKSWGGYAGLSFRATRAMKKYHLVNSEGQRDMAAHGKPARWLDFTGVVDGKDAGIAFFDHPGNQRYPTPMFIVMRGTFGYCSPAFLFKAPYRLAPGKSLTLFYRVLVHPGTLAKDQLEAEFRTFSALPHPARAR